ncbi:MAG: SpoIIE family protein phosphatase [Thermotogaceae bacterium]|nr:SpoIIE family protein phosphatase [Thermotogaceae bacterium]
MTKWCKKIPVSVAGFPLKDENENITGAIEMFEDASESGRELVKAYNIQKSLSPKSDDRVYILYSPSNVLGGDFVYYKYPWIMLIGVSGQGVASALLSTSIMIMIDKILEENDLAISQIPGFLEKEFSKLHSEGYFTAIIGKFTGNGMGIISCGHPDFPVYDESTGEVEILKVNNAFPIEMGFSKAEALPLHVETSGRWCD